MSTELLSPVEDPLALSEIDEIADPMHDLLQELKTNLLNSCYGLIIGDDTKGTYPAIIINTIANKLNQSLGRAAVPFVLLQGSSLKADRGKITQQLEKRSAILPMVDRTKNALIVTEHIAYGASVNNFLQVLSDQNLDVDIASISARYDRKSYSFAERLYVARENSIRGTYLSSAEDLHGRSPVKYGKERFQGVKAGVIFDPRAREKPRLAFKASRQLAERLYQGIFAQDVLEMTDASFDNYSS